MTETGETVQETISIAQPSSTLLTVLIADVRGYTRFTVEHGDEAAGRLTSRFAEICEVVVGQHEGQLIELRGDEALGVFPSARNALRAAVGLQAAFREAVERDPSLPLRVGIGLDAGEVVPVKGGYRGSALNLAARLCSLAGPGEVLASDAVTHLARKMDEITYTDRGQVQLKGFVDPVTVLEVAEETGSALAGPISDADDAERPQHIQDLPIGGFLGALPANPLVGRRGELSRILAAADAAASGESRLVMLAGEPGAGKTRLAQEVTLAVRNGGFMVVAGSCFESRQNVPFYPFLDVLVTLYDLAPPTLRALVPKQWPYLGRLIPEAGMPPSRLSNDPDDQERLFRTVTGFMQAMTEIAPIALLLDDLHWADQSSLDLLEHLAPHMRGNGILFVGTYRDVEVGRQHPLERALSDLHRQGLLERIAIRRLDEADTMALVASTFGEDDISSEFGNLIYQHTEGNPFFTQEVLRTLVERGDLFQRDGVWERRELAEIEVPESIRAVVGQRLSGLSDRSQTLLRTASVLGQRFSFDDLAAISVETEDEVEEALVEAGAAGLIRAAERDIYAFNHALTQQALYAELPPRRKRRLHLSAGDALEHLPPRRREERVAELAWHFLEGDDPERGLQYSLLAGDQAEAITAHGDAERHYRSALELAEEIDDQARIAEASYKLGMVYFTRSEPDDALPLLEQAARAHAGLDDPVMEGRALQPITFIYRLQKQNHQKSREVLERVEQLLDRIDRSPHSRDQVLFYHFLSRVYVATARDHEAIVRVASRGIEASRAIGDENLLARMEVRRSEALGMSGRIQEANSLAQRIILQAEASGNTAVLVEALEQAAEFSMFAGDFERSLHFRRLEYNLYAEQGSVFEHAFALNNLAQITLLRGEWRESVAFAEQALTLGREIANAFVVETAQWALGDLALNQGDLDVAAARFQEAASIKSGTVQMGLFVQRGLAELDILTGHPAEALARLAQLEAANREDNDTIMLLPTLAWAALDDGDVERGARLAAEAVEHARASENAIALVDALHVQGMVRAHQGQWEEARQTFEEDVSLSHPMPYPYAEARALYAWGLMEQSRGDAAAARERLEQAMHIFQRLGAGKYIEMVNTALVETARTEESGPDQQIPAENPTVQ